MSGQTVNPNGGYYLNDATLHDNGGSDHLEADSCEDWYFARLGDKFDRHNRGEVVALLSRHAGGFTYLVSVAVVIRATGQNPGVLPELMIFKELVSHSEQFCPVALRRSILIDLSYRKKHEKTVAVAGVTPLDLGSITATDEGALP